MQLLIRGGRVVDPRAGTETVADVLVDGDVVHAVGPALAAEPGATVVDATGLVVGPGFVDLHSHAGSVAGHRLQALDGVTTALELEAGLLPVDRAYREAAQTGRPLHHGFSASWAAARAQVLAGVEPDADIMTVLSVLDLPAWQATSGAADRDRWVGLLEDELGHGALGVGVLMGYAPQTDPEEFLAVARLAARAGVPTFTHVRELVENDPQTPVDGPTEIVRAADLTGARMHHCHVNSTSRRHVDRVLRTLDDARAAGSPITVEAYPYGAGSTAIGAFFLSPERLRMWGLRPDSLVMVATGERIADEARLLELRRSDPGAPCLVHVLDESDPADLALLRAPLAFAESIVASDAMPVIWPGGRHESLDWPLPPGGTTHPRTAGTFAKTLRLMVRETATWTWVEAFRRCSYLPARVLDDVAPVMRDKGWLAPGAAADLVVLDPERITDSATYEDPTRPSVGVRHLLVAGESVVRDGELQPDVLPGRPVRGEPR